MITKKTAANIFSENVARFRQQRGFSQYDLAEMTGISQRMISHYEKEGILPPTEKLDLLANALGVQISQLFENTISESNTSADFTGIDSRSVKKLKDILSLSPEDRNDLYRILNKMVRSNNQLKNQN